MSALESGRHTKAHVDHSEFMDSRPSNRDAALTHGERQRR